jgi:hypothetical protein
MTGSPCTSVGSLRAAHGKLWASPVDREISSANRREIRRDAIAGSSQAERRRPNRVSSANAESSIPTVPCHNHGAAGDVVHASALYGADGGERDPRFQAGAAT